MMSQRRSVVEEIIEEQPKTMEEMLKEIENGALGSLDPKSNEQEE